MNDWRPPSLKEVMEDGLGDPFQNKVKFITHRSALTILSIAASPEWYALPNAKLSSSACLLVYPDQVKNLEL